MYEGNEYMSSSEQLVAFLDGELSPDEVTTLFYELANNPELQEEMRQHVQIRNALRNAQLAPPPELKNNIMQAVGLVEADSYGVAYFSKRISALLIALFYSKVSLSIFIIALMSLVGYLMYDANYREHSTKLSANIENTTNSDINNNNNSTNNSTIPVISSYNSDRDINKDVDNTKLSNLNNQQSTNNKILANSRATSKKSNSILSNSRDILAKSSLNNSRDILSNQSLDNSNSLNMDLMENTTLKNDYIYPIEQSNLQKNETILDIANNKFNFQTLKFDRRNDLANIMQNTELNITKRMTSSEPNINLANESSHIINDMSIELKYNLSPNHSIGIAYGLENFKMTFDKDIAGVIYRYNQSWDAGWLALTYQYRMGELYDTGLIPSVNLLAGATSVGPLIRAGAGLNYYITDNFYLNAGFDTATLIFQESQSNNANGKWFTSNKMGWNFGFGVGF